MMHPTPNLELILNTLLSFDTLDNNFKLSIFRMKGLSSNSTSSPTILRVSLFGTVSSPTFHTKLPSSVKIYNFLVFVMEDF